MAEALWLVGKMDMTSIQHYQIRNSLPSSETPYIHNRQRLEAANAPADRRK
jgi:hypothetical protein